MLVAFLICCAHLTFSQTQKIAHAETVAVSFKVVSNIAAFAKTYPFLNKYLSDLREELKTMDTEIYAASVSIPNGKLLFLYLDGALYRGTEGMPVEAFLNQGKGFMSVFNATTYQEIKVVKSSSSCLAGQTAQQSNGSIMHKKVYFKKPQNKATRLAQSIFGG